MLDKFFILWYNILVRNERRVSYEKKNQITACGYFERECGRKKEKSAKLKTYGNKSRRKKESV